MTWVTIGCQAQAIRWCHGSATGEQARGGPWSGRAHHVLAARLESADDTGGASDSDHGWVAGHWAGWGRSSRPSCMAATIQRGCTTAFITISWSFLYAIVIAFSHVARNIESAQMLNSSGTTAMSSASDGEQLGSRERGSTTMN